MGFMDTILKETDHPLMFKKRAFIKSGEVIVGEICKVIDNEWCWICNNNSWHEVLLENLLEIEGE